jgi:hypothetical protein
MTLSVRRGSFRKRVNGFFVKDLVFFVKELVFFVKDFICKRRYVCFVKDLVFLVKNFSNGFL